MSTVYLLTGIIASGKSTWAKNNLTSNTFIVSKDKLREMIYGNIPRHIWEAVKVRMELEFEPPKDFDIEIKI